MKNFYDFIRRTSGKLNEAAGQVYDLTKEEDIFFTSTIAEDGNKYYQLRKLKNGKLTTSAIVTLVCLLPMKLNICLIQKKQVSIMS